MACKVGELVVNLLSLGLAASAVGIKCLTNGRWAKFALKLLAISNTPYGEGFRVDVEVVNQINGFDEIPLYQPSFLVVTRSH
jgi:hypothetical protein